MRVAVTGASGRIGSALCQRLKGYDVLAIDRRGGTATRTTAGTLSLDLSPSCLSTEHFLGVDVLYHLAGQSSPAAPPADIARDNVLVTYRVFEAACEAGVGVVVFASSVRVTDALAPDLGGAGMGPVRGPPKFTSECLARAIASESTRFAVVRLGGVQGPGMDYDSAPRPPDRHLVDVDDALACLLRIPSLMDEPFRLFTVVGRAGADHYGDDLAAITGTRRRTGALHGSSDNRMGRN